MKASIIIPTRNRAKLLARCLDSLQRQTLSREDFEVIVVDNGSTDETSAIVQQYIPKLQFIYANATKPGLHVGRHEGMRRAKTDILIFADDDIEAEPTWVEAVVDTFGDPRVAMVGGNNYPSFESEPPAWLRCLWNKSVYKGRALCSLSILDFPQGCFEIDPRYVWGCNFSIQRKVLLDAGGFHPDSFPKELLRFRGDGETHVSNVVRRSVFRTVFNSKASVWHFVPRSRMTKEYFAQRAYAQGISDSYSDIRQCGGFNIPLTSRFNRRISTLRPILTNSIRSFALPRHQEFDELLTIEKSMHAAYWQGYEFHHKQASTDSELLSWIMKKDYFD